MKATRADTPSTAGHAAHTAAGPVSASADNRAAGAHPDPDTRATFTAANRRSAAETSSLVVAAAHLWCVRVVFSIPVKHAALHPCVLAAPHAPDRSHMEYVKALEQAALLADRTGQSAFVIGDGDDYAVLSYKPKLLGGRSIQEVPPRGRSPANPGLS